MKTVSVLHTIFDRLPEVEFQSLINRLPQNTKARVLQYRRWEDQHATLTGRLLLLQGLQERTRVYDLRDVRYTEFNRPYIDGLDFSIAHSGRHVVCAISSEARVGVDVEVETDTDLAEFKEQFTLSEWHEINSSPNPQSLFFNFWTRKEAIIKADGRGLGLPLQHIDVRENSTLSNGVRWYIYEITLRDTNCYAHLATEVAPGDINIEVNYCSWPIKFSSSDNPFS